MRPFHHRKLPDVSTLLSGRAPRDDAGFQSARLQIWCNSALALFLFLLLAACAPHPLAGPEPTAPPTPSPAPHNPGVADLLRDPPAPMQPVEVDAYFSGMGAEIASGPPPPPDQVACPWSYGATLADRPFPATLFVLNSTQSNPVPDDAPWLIATVPDATRPGVKLRPQFPYHARFRGYLGDPAFDHCPDDERIFVVEAVVTVYEAQPPELPSPGLILPDDYAAWPRYHDAALGYSLPYPPDWTVEPRSEPDLLAAVALRGPRWPDFPVIVRVHAGETYYDPFDPASTPPLMQGTGWGVFEQEWAFGQQTTGSQHLAGYTVEREAGSGAGEVAALFSAHGRTYELALPYPTGVDASQALLTAYSAIVEGFRLDAPPGPTPTPPVKQSLGAGPFLSQEEALARLRERDGDDVELLEATLVAQVEARGLASACDTFAGHPEGVWVLTVRGVYEGMARTMRFFLDAASGEQLCGEELSLGATSWPTMPPGVTATPAPAFGPALTAPFTTTEEGAQTR